MQLITTAVFAVGKILRILGYPLLEPQEEIHKRFHEHELKLLRKICTVCLSPMSKYFENTLFPLAFNLYKNKSI